MERVYVIPLRKAYMVPRTKRTDKAVRVVREFLARHMKADLDNVKLGKSINETLWARGLQKPPRKIKVKAVKETDVVRAEIVGYKEEAKRKAELRAKKKPVKAETKKTEKKEEKVSEKKPAEKPVKKEAAGKKAVEKVEKKAETKKTVKKPVKREAKK